ncbi:two pore channel protein 2-like isoform X2 [Paramormyrops kingsleyae]|uniref:two pore channel protein 2-like isoform X2 n=1 Tax=Paramormyrops kingsleyae TaxID=1676925 RepID=UPI000CD5DFF2|nr:two pore calcium channel protein 2-like isoform X2 [Paramormyrops kingsleyae]
MMEKEPLLTESINQRAASYGSAPGAVTLSGSSKPGEDSYQVEGDEDDIYIRRAVVFIEDAIHYRSINHRVDSKSLRVYRWYYSWIWQWGMILAIAVILGLAFVERPSSLSLSSDPRYRQAAWEPPCGLTEGIETAFLIIFAFDVTVKSYLIGWTEFKKNKWLISYTVVIAGSLMDLIVSLSMVCGENIRVRRLFRPFFLLQNSSLMKKTLKSLKKTLPEIASVVLLLALHLCLFTMFGMLLFAKREKSEENAEWETYFRNLPLSLSSLLVLLTTANNPDVMTPAYSLNRLYAIFFIAFSVIGTYLIMNLLTAIIYNQFRGYLLVSMQESVLRRRLGIRAAFEVLCCRGQAEDQGLEKACENEQAGGVQVKTIEQVLQQVQAESYYKHAIMTEVQQLTERRIQSQTFQNLFDVLERDRIKEPPPMPEYRLRCMQTLQFLFSHYYMTLLGNIMALANVVCIFTVLVVDSEKSISDWSEYYLEVINLSFVIFYLLEMVLKIVAFGLRGYLFYRSNILDGLLTLSLVALQMFILVKYGFSCPKWDLPQPGLASLWEIVRMVNMLIVFRCLRIIPKIKVMAVVASTLVDLVRNLRAFAGILLAVYYVYAVLGIWLFHEAITAPANVSSSSNSSAECGSYEQLGYWPNNFDDFASALVLLYNVMVVNNWHVFLEAYTKHTTEWSKVYFIAWWLTSSVMWVNLFVALILENFTYKWDRSQDCLDVERIKYESSVQLMFRDLQEPTEEELAARLLQHPHLHLIQ